VRERRKEEKRNSSDKLSDYGKGGCLMKGIAAGMKSLCEDILTGDEDRKSEIKQIKGQAEVIRDNARKFLAVSHKFQKEMSQELKKGLREGREDLIKKVKALREDFIKKEKKVRTDLAEANRIWNMANDVLKSRRTKSLQTVNK